MKFTGAAPLLVVATLITPGTGSLSVSGVAPPQNIAVSAPTGSLSVAGGLPSSIGDRVGYLDEVSTAKGEEPTDSAELSYPIRSGTNRYLIVAITQEGDTQDELDTPPTATYGGQSMTRHVGALADAALPQRVDIFGINEAGISAATNDNIVFSGVPQFFTIHARSFHSVDQDNPIPETDSDSTLASTPNPLLLSISASDKSAVVSVSGCGQGGSTATWQADLTKRSQVQHPDASPTLDGSLADNLFATGQTVQCECTWSIQNRAAAAAVEVAPITGATITPPTGSLSLSGNVPLIPQSITPGNTGLTFVGNQPVIDTGIVLPSQDYSDDFNRDDENPLSQNGKWSTATDSVVNLKVVSNELVLDSGTSQTGISYRNSDNLGPDQYARAKINTNPITANFDWKLFVRFTDGVSENRYGLAIWDQAGATYHQRLFKWVGGVFTWLGTDQGETPLPGDIYEVRIIGTTLSFYRNGVFKQSVTVTDHASGTAAIEIWGYATKLDDFECGSFGLVIEGQQPKLDIGIIPPTGSIALTGNEPTIPVSPVITPPSGSLAISGLAPSVVTPVVITPPTGSLSLDGIAPTTKEGQSITIPAGALSLAGNVPTQGIETVPAAGILSIAGYAPDIFVDQSIEVPVGDLTFSGLAPEIGIAVSVPQGSMSLSGESPSAEVGSRIIPPAGAIGISGIAPAQDIAITPPSGSLSLSGNAPELAGVSKEITPGTGQLRLGLIVGDTSITPASGSLAISGASPGTGISIFVGSGSLGIVGLSPKCAITITPPSGILSLNGQTPTLYESTPGVITVPTGSLSLVGYIPDLGRPVTPPSGALSLSGYPPIIGISNIIQPPTGSLSLSGLVPKRGAGIVAPAGSLSLAGVAPYLSKGIVPASGIISLAGVSPTLSITSHVAKTPPSGQLAITGNGFAIKLNNDVYLTVPSGQLVISGIAPEKSFEKYVPQGSLAIVGYAPGVIIGVTPGTGILSISGNAPVLSESAVTQITPGAGQLLLSGLSPSLLHSNVIQPPTGIILIPGFPPFVQDGLIWTKLIFEFDKWSIHFRR